ncbi:PQQ-binding-like beta-propeller repeat protein [Nocardiopsis sp. HNM0947]|uniref:PQQ-binding-like beta-propeller repeat protein n=1 Tax=Nocardiopsis coralli TaxID=2772213 RepID=A0ABR9P4S8_9ACTN|nr:PQQ-binding-like beta-propeller repeat protein [Nocardiopsis coralli]MBE2998831.1 PQQ-binding-like beta-propeller repeat protein [Nocardiopsis coralli]
MRSARVPLACGIAMLLVTGCTGDPEPAEPQNGEAEPSPPPTEFRGELPPGLEGEVLRHLHGEDADVHPMLDDGQGVRISPVDGAFLISSDGEDRHLLHDAATGETLWEGEAGFRGFASDADGDPVLLMADTDDVPFVLGPDGEQVWSADDPDDAYLDGLVVEQPDGWSEDEPEGAFTVSDTDGDELWSYDFELPEDTDGDDEDGSEEDGDGDTPDDEEDPPLGVPVAAWDDTVLLSDGETSLHAHSLDADEAGEELWSVTGEDEELGLPDTAAGAVPQILGRYTLPAEDEAADGEEDDGEAEEDGDELLLLRWAQPEAPSTLSAHDPATGETAWSLREPGTNPAAEPFAPSGATGSLYDEETGTLLLQQASGEASLIAVDLAEGEELWGLEDDDTAISPAFAFDGFVYGDQRGDDNGNPQLVLDAVTMDVVDDELSARVEAVTETGHAILVQDRQRFVVGPPPEDGEDEEPSPDDDPS